MGRQISNALALVLSTAIVLVACDKPSTATTSATTSTTVAETLPPVGGIVWGDATAIVEPMAGWTAHACPGDAPLVCVLGPQGEKGLVEVGRFPLDSMAASDEAEDPLRTLARDFVVSIADDREIGCGSDYRVEPIEPSSAVVAGEIGLRFGFIGLTGDGTVSERNIQHAVLSGDDLVLITAAAYEAGGCPGRDDLDHFEPAGLEEFDRGLSALVRGLTLP